MHKADIVPDRYNHHCISELLKVLVYSHISFKAIELEMFCKDFVGSEILLNVFLFLRSY